MLLHAKKDKDFKIFTPDFTHTFTPPAAQVNLRMNFRPRLRAGSTHPLIPCRARLPGARVRIITRREIITLRAGYCNKAAPGRAPSGA